MHAVLQSKAPRLPVLLKLDRVTTGKTTAAVFRIGFEDKRLQTAFGQMQRGGQSGQSTADDESVWGVFSSYQDSWLKGLAFTVRNE